jgi:hypothetical protein
MKKLTLGIGLLMILLLVMPVAALYQATGGGSFSYTGIATKSSIAFAAYQIDTLNNANGYFTYHYRYNAPDWPKTVSYSGDIVYLKVDGDTACWAGIITETTSPPGYIGAVGDGFSFKFTDGQPDMFTHALTRPASYAIEDCNAVWPVTVELTNGNFKIK